MIREHFAPDEWYHCYTRGVDKRQTFLDHADYRRFQELLFLCNNFDPVHRSNLGKYTNVFVLTRETTLVHIGAYCLMPNHFHLLLREEKTGGITTFMRKLGTGYSMYFNKRYERVGNLFVKPFRSGHVADDSYARQVSAYIHLNPLDVHTPTWKENGTPTNTEEAQNFLEHYFYSSLPDYIGTPSRPERHILSENAMSLFATYVQNNSLQSLIKHATDFLPPSR